MSTLKVDNIVDSEGGNTTSINGFSLTAGTLSPEDRIINGAFDIWQRGTSFTTSVYGADRWVNAVGGGSVTMSRQSFALGDTLGSNNPTYFLRQTVSGQTLASQYATFYQPIEGVRSYAGQTITILGWARRSSGSGNMAVSITQSFGTGGSPSATVDGAGQTVTLTGSFAPFAVTFAIPSIAGKTLGTNGNDWIAPSFWVSAGSDYNVRSNSLGLQTIGVDIWGVHIKVGTHTVDAVNLYKQPELGLELTRCQRYYRTGSVYGWGYTGGAVAVRAYPERFGTQMRAAPTVAFSGITYGNCNTLAVDGVAASYGFNAKVIGGAAGGYSVDAVYTADAEL